MIPRAEISVYCSAETWDLVEGIFIDTFCELVEKVESKAAENKIGLPWKKEPRQDLGPEEYDWELDEAIEISIAIQRGGSVGGSSWTLYDFWQEREPPCFD